MTHPEAYVYHPRIPDRQHIKPESIAIDYDDAIDALYVHFSGQAEPGISIDIDDDVYLRIDPTSEKVVGLQVETFLARAVIEHPSLLILAEAAGIPDARLAEVRGRIDAVRLKDAALDETFDWLLAGNPPK